MEFKLNRNNKILQVELKSRESEDAIRLGTIELNRTYIEELEQILNQEKLPTADSCFMAEKLIVPETDAAFLQTGQKYTMNAEALSLAGQNIYCFDLYLDGLYLEKIGSKKRDGQNIVFKNVKFKYLSEGTYTASEVSGLMNQDTNNTEISVVTGDRIASVKL